MLLQGELRLLGFTIPDEEVARATFGPSTRQAVLDFQTTHRLPANGVVDEATATQINAAVELLPAPPRSFVVRGEVRQADGRPAERHLVRVFDRDLRSAQELGTGHTGADGRFNIRYKDSDFARTEKATADLTFQLESQEGQSIETFQLYRRHNGQQILVESPQILFNASAFEAVEIVIGAGMYQGDSEYEGYIAQLPLLQGLAIAELVENERYQDITFLTGETGIDPQHIAFLITAHLLERTTRLEAAIFYGFLRKQLPSALPALLCYNPAAQRRALEAALREKIIPARLEAELDEILARLQALEAKQPAFLIQPQVLFSSLADLSTLSREQSGFVTEKLNEYLRSAIFAALGPVSQTMRRAIYLAIARLDYQKDKETNLATFIQERILAQVKRNQNLAQEAAKLAARLADATPTRVADVLHLDSALQVNPLFATELRHAKTFEYARLAQLDDRLARKLVEQNLRLDEADETTLTNLVTDGQLTEQQKKKLYQTLELGRLSGDNLPLIAALQTRGAHAAADLIGWEQADWQQFLTDERLPLPFGETAETYGSTLRLSLEQTYPSQALLHRLARREAARPISLLDSLQPLLIHNNRLIDGHAPAHVDWSGVSDQERARLEADLNDLASWANTCRRLGVVELVNDPALNLEQKKNAISTRLKLLDSFYQNNPEVDLRLVNFFAQSDNTLNWQGVPDAERPLVRQQLMAYQRVLSLADDTADRQLLLSKGYDAAFMMIGRSEAEFVKTSGLPPGKAKMSYYKAMQSAVSASHYLATIQDEVKGPFRHVAAANLPPHLLNDLQEIDGFDDLFGAQDFCDCEECRSMFSPAAYFVDLMYFIEQNISHPVFMYPYPPSINPMDTDHPLYLKNRRPDLWTLPLTCENPLPLIPSLTIVNEVLETYLNKVVNDDIYAKLSDVDEPQISFGLPFTLPLEEMRLYLSHFGLTLSDIFRTLQQDEDRIWRARLSLSVDEFTAITVSEPTIVRLRFGNPPSLDDFPVEDETGQPGAERRGFIKFAGITRQQLDELRQLRFNQDLAKILVTKKITPDELIYFPEILQNLTDARLDFIHRFLRLWRKVGWSIPDLDLVLYTLHEAGLIGLDLEGKAVLVVAQLVDLQEKLKLTVEELCALAGQLPVSTAFPFPPATQADRGLYERLFDLKKLFGENPATHKINPTAIYHHYSLNSNNPNDHEIDPKTPILLGGLGVSETELLLLFDLLKEEMPFDKNGDTKDPQGESTFDRGRVSLLYRHARLAKALRLNVEDFIQALHLNFANDDLVVTTLTQIHQLRQFRDWLRT
ncbi:MAG TPA: peptidoglycan-binding protein, partial [Caldilineaceae bacterium]|nr:peptidoglycan-binding protein [Caldilineaceae bacterium]